MRELVFSLLYSVNVVLSGTGRWRPRVNRRRVAASIYGAPEEAGCFVYGLIRLYIADIFELSHVDYIFKSILSNLSFVEPFKFVLEMYISAIFRANCSHYNIDYG